MNIFSLIALLFVTICVSYKYNIGGGCIISFFDRSYTTIAKGVAILLIMVGHCFGLWFGGRILTPCGGIGVAMFLITSGYGLNESYKRNGLAGFWKKRLGRVYLPYLFVAIIYAIVQQWDVHKCMLNFTCVHSPYWFITYIVECYIVFYIVSRITSKYRNIIFVAISASTIFYMPELQAEQALSFVSGILLSTHKGTVFRLLEEKKQYYSLCIFCGFVGFSFLAFKQLPFVREGASVVIMNIIQLLIKYPIAVFILLSLNFIKPILRNPFIYLAGLISYELYLVHFPFYTLIGERLWPALVLFVLSFAVAYPFYKINNRVHQKVISK